MQTCPYTPGKYNILTSLNHGFRSGYSCETQLIMTLNDLLQSYDQNKQTDVVILDFSKAFDTVPHDKLMYKLEKYGIKGDFHKWLTSFLTKREMRVIIEGVQSNNAVVESGVPQGTVPEPLLFLCHINDLPECVKSQVCLFADDCLLYRQIKNREDHILLQNDLTYLEEWAQKWGMRFNAKCYVNSIKGKSSYLYNLRQDSTSTSNSKPISRNPVV